VRNYSRLSHLGKYRNRIDHRVVSRQAATSDGETERDGAGRAHRGSDSRAPLIALAAAIAGGGALGANVPGLENIANLDRLPERGAWVIVPMKIAGGSGAPLRIVAVLPYGRK
jgi:hypothetical protein